MSQQKIAQSHRLPPRQRAVRLWLTLLGATSTLLTAGATAGPSQTHISTAADRKEVGITVYNQDFGLVREVREVDTGRGVGALEFRDVAAQIQPETVHIKAAAGGGLRVLEQNYRYDLLTPQKLLDKYVGKKVRVYRYFEKAGKDKVYDARILSVQGGQPVLKIGGEITFGFPGRLAFPKLPNNLIAKPTLMWMIDSQKPRQRLEATYLTRNIGWRADYVLVLNSQDSAGDLTGWVTLNNTSGTSYRGAHLKLVAGDVNRVRQPGRGGVVTLGEAKLSRSAQNFREEGFFEYHLYTLERPTDVLDKEQKQVTLLEARGAKITKKLMFFGQPYWYRGRYGQVMSNQKVGVYLDLMNSKSNGLGMPLPKGTVRVYKADKSGAKQFVGEDHIDHTPRDEKLRIKMGEAFDVVGDRKQMAWHTFGTCTSESEWEIALRNHKDTAVQVEDIEPVAGDWTIVSSSHPHHKKDARTFTFEVTVPARGKVKIHYRIRVRWC